MEEMQGLELTFLESWDNWDGDTGCKRFSRHEYAGLKLTTYAKEVLKDVFTPSPFIIMDLDTELSEVIFYRDDATKVKFKVTLTVIKE